MKWSQQMVELGKSLRAHRQHTKMSLSEAATKSDLSPSFISLVENAKTDITIGRLNRLLAVYGMTISDVYASKPTSTSRSDRQITNDGNAASVFESQQEGVTYRIFKQSGNFIPVHVTIHAQGRWNEPSIHEFDEYDFVLTGSIQITAGTTTEKLTQGESTYIPAMTPHMYKNDGACDAELFVILRTQFT